MEGYGLAVMSYSRRSDRRCSIPDCRDMTLAQNLTERWPVVLVCLYMPALFLVLRHPNADGPAAVRYRS